MQILLHAIMQLMMIDNEICNFMIFYISLLFEILLKTFFIPFVSEKLIDVIFNSYL